MKLLLLLICNLCLWNVQGVKNYLMFTIDRNSNNIAVDSYSSGDNQIFKSEIFKIYNSNSKRLFVYKQDSIYIDYDKKPAFQNSLIKYFASRIKYSTNEMASGHDMAIVAFIIDKNGKINYKGFLSGCSNLDYKKQIVNILDDFNLTAKPAKVSGNRVSSLYWFKLDFFDEEFLKHIQKK